MNSTQKTAISHRIVCLDRLARVTHSPSSRPNLWHIIRMRRLCLVLWELPRHVQLGLVVTMAERYLPIYERKRPNRTQLREFFVRCRTVNPPTDDEIEAWYGSLSWEECGDLADRALFVALERAAEAIRSVDQPAAFTSACMLSIVYSIGAGKDDVWIAIDPEAAAARLEDLRRDEDEPALYHPSKYRSPLYYAEVRNATYAGWDAVVDWLRAADVGMYPDYVDRKKLAWMLRELKILPRVVRPPYPDRRPARPPRRTLCLEWLERALHAWSGSAQHRFWASIATRRLCLVLWEMPQREQIDFTAAIIERYLHTLERRHPHLTQVRAFLARCRTADPLMYIDDEASRRTGLLVTAPLQPPDPPAVLEIDRWYHNLSPQDRGEAPAERLLVASLRFVAQAAAPGAAATTITSACVLSVLHAIGVGVWEAWEALEPEATKSAQEDSRRANQDLPPLPFDWLEARDCWPPSVLSAVQSGWEAVVAWFRVADVDLYSGDGHRNALAKLVRQMKTSLGPSALEPARPAIRKDTKS